MYVEGTERSWCFVCCVSVVPIKPFNAERRPLYLRYSDHPAALRASTWKSEPMAHGNP